MVRWTKGGLMLTVLLAGLATPVFAQSAPSGVGGGGTPTAAPMTEAAFIELAGTEKPGEGGTPEPGRPHESAKSIEEPTKSEEEEPAPDAGADSGDGGAGSGDDEEAGDDDGTDDASEATGSSADDGADAADEDDGADDPPVLSAKQQKLDAEFEAALKAEGVSTSLDDLPEDVRPLVQKKLKDFEKGFTKAMQQTRADQKAAVTFKAEERFRKDKPADFIVSMLLDNPALSEAVNARIENLEGNATAVEGHKALVEKARADAAKAEEGEIEKGRQNEEKIERLVMLGRAAARAAGVPFDMGVEEGIAAHIALYGDISETEIRTIATAKAAVYQRQLRQDRRDRRGQYVKDKVADRKTAGLRVKPGQGRAPAPAARKVAKNDQDFIEEFVSRS